MPDHLRKFVVFILLENITDFSIYWHEMSIARDPYVSEPCLASRAYSSSLVEIRDRRSVYILLLCRAKEMTRWWMPVLVLGLGRSQLVWHTASCHAQIPGRIIKFLWEGVQHKFSCEISAPESSRPVYWEVEERNKTWRKTYISFQS